MPINRLLLTRDDLEPGTRIVYTDRAGSPLAVTVAEVRRPEGTFTTRTTRSVPALTIAFDDVRAGHVSRRPTRRHTLRIATADPQDPARPGDWFVAWCAKCGWQTVALAVEAAARYQFRRYHQLPARKAPTMPLPSTATLLTALANTALEDSDIDPNSVEAFAAHGLARITFASSGDPAVDRGAVEQINGELCISQHVGELGLTLPVIVRPKDDDAALRAAANSLRHLATLLDRAVTGDDQDRPTQLDRATALKFAENVLSSVG